MYIKIRGSMSHNEYLEHYSREKLFKARPEEIPKNLIKWTDFAKYCFKIHCICENCLIRKSIETPCMMKTIVRQIYTVLGKPEG